MKLERMPFNIKLENREIKENQKESTILLFLKEDASLFLGDETRFVDTEIIDKVIRDVSNQEHETRQEMENTKNDTVIYDRYHKSFSVRKDKGISIGEIVSARRWGVNVSLPKELENFGDGKRVRKLMLEARSHDVLCSILNKELSTKLSTDTQKRDALLSRAYSKVAERSLSENIFENKQTGVLAEQVIIGLLEGLSIDHPEFGFKVTETNAYQDVQNKIDFILSTKEKKRGVGVNREDSLKENKTIGIQLTTNSNSKEHKIDQINKAKERGVDVDDIVYVEIKKETLENAIKKWEELGKKISGPWSYLPEDLKTRTAKSLLDGFLTEEQERSLQKIILQK